MPVRRTEPVVQVRPLEHVEPPVEEDLPAGVRHEVPGVDRTGPVVGPGELDPKGRDPVPDLLQIAGLALQVLRVRGGQQIEPDVLPVRLAQGHHLQELHQVAHLVVDPDVGVRERDLRRPVEPGAEERVEADPLLVLREGNVAGRGA